MGISINVFLVICISLSVTTFWAFPVRSVRNTTFFPNLVVNETPSAKVSAVNEESHHPRVCVLEGFGPTHNMTAGLDTTRSLALGVERGLGHDDGELRGGSLSTGNRRKCRGGRGRGCWGRA